MSANYAKWLVALFGMMLVAGAAFETSAAQRIGHPLKRPNYGKPANVKAMHKAQKKQAAEAVAVHKKQLKEVTGDLKKAQAEFNRADLAANRAEGVRNRNPSPQTTSAWVGAVAKAGTAREALTRVRNVKTTVDGRFASAKAQLQTLKNQNWRQYKTAQEVRRGTQLGANRRAREALIERRAEQQARVAIPAPPRTAPPPLPPANLAVPSRSLPGNRANRYKAPRPRTGAKGGNP